jgi:hypothetical protein
MEQQRSFADAIDCSESALDPIAVNPGMFFERPGTLGIVDRLNAFGLGWARSSAPLPTVAHRVFAHLSHRRKLNGHLAAEPAP